MPDINGNLSGIRQSLLDEMKRLYDWPVGRDEFIPAELADLICEYSHRLKREISLFIARNGEILDISIGSDAQVQLKEFRLRRSESRLSRVRCIHTHPSGSAELSDVDLSAARSLWLDAMSAIGIDEEGRIIGVSAVFLGEKIGGIPSLRFAPVVSLRRLPQEGWMQEIERSERLVQLGEGKDETRSERALLLGIESEESLDELEELCKTAGGTVVGRVLQKRARPEGATYVGAGRAEQLSLDAQALEADLIIADDELTGIQTSNLERITGIKVVDRTTLILDIFAGRATSSEGKLQVELAQLAYRSTHLVGARQELSRLGGGIGTRGPGESKLEIDRRRIRERITELKRQLKEIEKQRALRRKAREKNGLPVVALVGYTNTGKSTLLNRVAGADVYAKNELFATLDAVSRRVETEDGDAFLLVDSVGFIRKLPTELVEAFHSTLEEAALADVLVIVSDASDAAMQQQHAVVESVLTGLGATNQPRIEVLNKCDRAPAFTGIPPKDALFISAKTGEGVDALLRRIQSLIRNKERTYVVLVPFDRYALLSEVKNLGRVLSEKHTDLGTEVMVSLDSYAKGKLQSKWGEDIFERM